ncbi:MAG: hypothetical protein IJZ73_03985 [Clostridia bacterium]|nr:hypothetical protein [Clostridia bacterium]
MEFTLPTTKEEMYSTLKELYQFYRIRRQLPVLEEIQPLSLEKMDVPTLTEEEVKQIAIARLKPLHTREILKEKSTINAEISGLELKYQIEQTNCQLLIEKTEKSFDESIEKVKRQAENNGVAHSSIIIDKIAKLESDKINAVAKIQQESDDKIADIISKKVVLEEKVSTVDSYFEQVFTLEINKECETVKNELYKKQTDAFKYNNAIDEKEQRYQGTITSAKASLELKLSQIVGESFSKEQLVEMGYYSDVIKCVTAYYDTLAPLTAYQDLSGEKDVIIYLDEYYSNVLYNYQMRAVS